ncbi:MAG: 30S ribosomal protein S3ae [Thermoprotei archaeon]|nr:MAG: 30S ribosomal protein S3ae [Thermoprotei archaeon]
MSRVARKDRWALKKWYTVYASSAFGYAELGEVPALVPEYLIGRTIEVTLFDITKDISQLHVKLKFQIKRVEGDKAYTQFKGMELARDYIRSLVRRGTTKVDGYIDVFTKDGNHLRVGFLAVTAYRCKKSQERAIRKIAFETIAEKASQLGFDEFIQEAVLGKIAAEIFARAKKIYPLKKVEIMKIKVFSAPPVLTPEEYEAQRRAAEKAVEKVPAEATSPT